MSNGIRFSWRELAAGLPSYVLSVGQLDHQLDRGGYKSGLLDPVCHPPLHVGVSGNPFDDTRVG